MINFLYFERQDGTQTNCAKIPGYQLFGDQMDDVDFKLTITDGKMSIESLNTIDFFGNSCDQEINDDIKNIHIDWDGGYEFLDYSDLTDDSKLKLVADRSSNVSNILNSKQNITNLNRVRKLI